MKIGTTLFALFILSAFTSHLPSATAVLVDTDGQLLRNGGTYYVLPVMTGEGGGITQAETGNETCPFTVVQSRSAFDIGKQVHISSPAKIKYLTEGVNVNLEFTSLVLCAPPQWTIVDDGLPHGHSVKLVGYENTVAGGFRIRSIGLFGGYKLVFCPTSADTCSDIGVWVDPDGFRRLVVSDKINPLAVVFKNTASATPALVDTDGQPLRNGGIYYILSPQRGGGITQAATGNETCPLTVVQSPSSRGSPVQISSPLKIMYLSQSMIVDLEFAAFFVCAPPKWTIVDDGLPYGASVKIAGFNNTLDGGFRIWPIGLFGGYKLVFCPRSIDSCSDIGVWVDPDGSRRLVVSDKINPLAVVFKNAGLVPAAAAA